MGKTQNIPVPTDAYVVYAVLAKSRGTTARRMIMDAIKRNWAVQLFAPFVKDGKFDERAWRADVAKASKALKQWDDENADALEELYALGNPPRRKRR